MICWHETDELGTRDVIPIIKHNHNISIFKDLNELSRAAADRFSKLVDESVTKRGKFTVALSGGGTPMKLFKLLAQPPHGDQLPWAKMHFFWGDERCVPPDHPESNYYQAHAVMLGKVPVPKENIHRIKGELEPEDAARDYAIQLDRFAGDDYAFPSFDLVLLGMGIDGHTASLFPGSITEAEKCNPTLAVTSDYQGRPANRVTLTPLVFNEARNIFFLVTGDAKAETFSTVLSDNYDPTSLPVQRISLHRGSISWLVDEAVTRQYL
jgi:6-phosphogluconolactonase